MPFVPGAHPEYEAFYNGLTGLDKEAFKRFRRSHPTLTNQEAMSMYKLNYEHYHHIGNVARPLIPTPLSEAFASLSGVITYINSAMLKSAICVFIILTPIRFANLCTVSLPSQ